ncbi:Low copy number virion structural protein [Bacillus chungangensis]|uniref:Low copy number virion structural protein n=1 Tax=Bacillus chungangensis TaxID=587633 RepID=A0ABT9WUD8_9BACI|nr:Low copy number virion structural protein [Bacillus chungangensis]MDQ0176733.1 hypothetical protein [Bacillus chungangensis]
MGRFNSTYMVDGRLQYPFFPSMPVPYIKGNRFEVSNEGEAISDSYMMPFDAELTGIAVACNKYNDEDYWSLKVNDELILETIYTKELPEGVFFMAVIPVSRGAEIKFIFNNKSGISKSVWYNLQFLRD